MKMWLCLWVMSLSLFAGDGPMVRVLGTAQDGGFPQIGCHGPHCQAARLDSDRRRLVSSLLIVDGEGRWLVDATPDLPRQVALLPERKLEKPRDGRRPRLVDGIFLTHAHMGHYTGLMHLGREVYNHQAVPLYGSKRMVDFLKSNGPWQLLFENQNLTPHPMEPDTKLALSKRVGVTPFFVPHREEFSDTFGFIITGPSKSLLFIPDINKWEHWDTRIEDKIAAVDYALLDGTFYASGEIPGRAMSEIPHPFITESMARFKTLPAKERNKIYFTHLNHSNPASDPAGAAQAAIKAAGMHTAADDQSFEL